MESSHLHLEVVEVVQVCGSNNENSRLRGDSAEIRRHSIEYSESRSMEVHLSPLLPESYMCGTSSSSKVNVQERERILKTSLSIGTSLRSKITVHKMLKIAQGLCCERFSHLIINYVVLNQVVEGSCGIARAVYIGCGISTVLTGLNINGVQLHRGELSGILPVVYLPCVVKLVYACEIRRSAP